MTFERTYQTPSWQAAPVLRHANRFGKQTPMAKQTKITIETDSLLILQGWNSRRSWCPQCGAEGEIIALDVTAVISNLDRPALGDLLNSTELHRSQAADGSTLICLNSLLARVRNPKTS